MRTDPRETTRQLLKPRAARSDAPRPARGSIRQAERQPSRLRRRSLALWGLACVLGLAGWHWISRQDAPPELAAAPQAQVNTHIASQPLPRAPAKAAAASGAHLRFEDLLRAAPGSAWRVARLAERPQILVIEFPDLLSQGKALNRLAALVEKRGAPRDRVLSLDEMADFLRRSGDSTASFYQGHDYASESVQRFFELIARQGLALNPEEAQLQRLLREAGFLSPPAQPDAGSPDSDTVQALVAFTAVQSDDPATLVDEEVDALRRETVLRHELSHGFFFTHAAYQQQVLAFWRNTLSEAQRESFRTFLASLDYDPGHELLMANETQAFLMHTPDPRVFAAELLGWTETQLTAVRAAFRAAVPAGMQVSAR